jgi:hypothetical protein
MWWLRLGIHIERIQPGQPQQNGRHERMYLTRRRRRMGGDVPEPSLIELT